MPYSANLHFQTISNRVIGQLRLYDRLALAIAALVLLVPMSFPASAAEDQYIETQVVKASVDYLAELSKRRRLTTIFHNQQHPFHGVQLGYVNATTGNLTFLNRDLVRLDRIPAVFGRVYDSRNSHGADFGPGWRLTFDESIVRRDSTLEFTDSTNSTYTLDIENHHVRPAHSALTGIESGEIRGNSITLVHAGVTKLFRRKNGKFSLVSVTDKSGNWLRILRKNGKIMGTVSSTGRRVEIHRDTNGRIIDAVDDSDRRVRFSYDYDGRLSKFQDLGDEIWTYKYNNQNQLTEIQDPRSEKPLVAQYNADGYVAKIRVQHDSYTYSYDNSATHITNAMSQTATFWAHESGLTKSIQDFSGGLSTIEFDASMNVKELAFNGKTSLTVEYDDTTPVVVEVVKSDSRISYRLRHVDDRLASVVAGDDEISAFEYDSKGQVILARDSRGIREYEYDLSGRVTKATLDEFQLRLVPNVIGIIERVYGDGILLARFGFDAKDRLTTFESMRADKRFEVKYEYEQSGFRDSASYYRGLIDLDFDYDAVGNMTRLGFSNIVGKSIEDRYVIGPANRLDKVIGQSGPSISFVYDPLGRPVQLHQDSRVAEIQYDNEGRTIGATVDDEQAFAIEYGSMDQDAVLAADIRTSRTSIDAPMVSAVFGSLESIAYARPFGSPYKFVRFDEQMARFIVSKTPFTAPDAIEVASLDRRMLPDGEREFDALPLAFDKPSNSLFIPAEYYSTNCFTCLGFISNSDIEVNGSDLPTDANVNQPITFDFTADGICRWREEENIFGLPPIYQPNVPPPANFEHYISYGDGAFQKKLSGVLPNISYTHAYSQGGTFQVLDFVRCSCVASFFNFGLAGHLVNINAPPTTEVTLALTFDDGPHLAIPAMNKTIAVMNTLNSKEVQYGKQIAVTFFVERERIGTTGQGILATMRDNGHQIAFHGVDPVHHTPHQNTVDMPVKLVTMKSIVTNNIFTIPTHIRPPFGWGGWISGPEYTQAELTTIYDQAGLTRYVDTSATGGVNSWFGGGYSRNGALEDGVVPRAVFVQYVKTAIDLSTSVFTPKRVLLLHDIRTHDEEDLGGVIDEIEAYAATKNVVINYRTVSTF